MNGRAQLARNREFFLNASTGALSGLLYLSYVLSFAFLVPVQHVFAGRGRRSGLVAAAFALVVAEGMPSLTARNLAAALHSSTIPVYLQFKGMEELKDLVRRRAYALLDDYMARKSCDDFLLNVGVGFIRFAFDYPNLCQALFIDRDCDKELLRVFDAGLAARIGKTPLLEHLSEVEMNELYLSFIIIMQGYASLVCAGYFTDSSTETIAKILRSVCHPAISHAVQKGGKSSLQ